MYSLSVKDKQNIPTYIKPHNNYEDFLAIKNQIYLTKHIYNLYKSVPNSRLNRGYLQFKETVPKRMFEWATRRNINKMKPLSTGDIDMLYYLNKLFINENRDLYESLWVNVDGIPKLDMNPYLPTANISHVDTFNMNGAKTDIIQTRNIPYKEITAADYGSLNLWEMQTTETNYDKYRYGNKIPIWQRSMNIRHYDKGNEGFQCTDSNRASLETPISGYNMKAVYDAYAYNDKKNNPNLRDYK